MIARHLSETDMMGGVATQDSVNGGKLEFFRRRLEFYISYIGLGPHSEKLVPI